MGENTHIEWAHHTFNPWEGCQKVGPGCDHCYAETRNARFGGGVAPNWGPGAPRRRTSASNWQQPLKWNREAERLGIRYRVFCASLADVFDNSVPQDWRHDLFALIDATPHLDWLLLTKRVGNVLDMADWWGATWPDNVWMGATIVNRDEMLRDAPKLKQIPARVLFWSYEPALGDLGDLPPSLMPDWAICGGESGPSARPMHPDWARSLRDQCAAAGVPFLFKQWGEWGSHGGAPSGTPGKYAAHWAETGRWSFFDEAPRQFWIFGADAVRMLVGKKAAGRLLDGVQHDGVPA